MNGKSPYILRRIDEPRRERRQGLILTIAVLIIAAVLIAILWSGQ